MILTRRKFFSFFGTGVVLAAKPELLLPTPYRPKEGEALFETTSRPIITQGDLNWYMFLDPRHLEIVKRAALESAPHVWDRMVRA